jgi:S-adenosylmethionine-diacylgycerolhomoserine-N-methlytransferase
MRVLADARTLLALAKGTARGGSHAERLQRFYAPQAPTYDAFRERMLHGRQQLIDLLPAKHGDHVIELGAGTGRTLEFFGSRLASFGAVEAIDLCPALLTIARARFRDRHNVRVIEADVTRYRPDAPADGVYFSYALTMIPEWKAAVENAIAMLRPGGFLGVVDFHLPATLHSRRWLPLQTMSNAFWRVWFAHDGVNLSSEQLPHLCSKVATEARIERFGTIPYLPGLRVPYYLFVGRKSHAQFSRNASHR